MQSTILYNPLKKQKFSSVFILPCNNEWHMLIARVADTFHALREGLGNYISALQIVIRRKALYKVLDFRWGIAIPLNVFLVV